MRPASTRKIFSIITGAASSGCGVAASANSPSCASDSGVSSAAAGSIAAAGPGDATGDAAGATVGAAAWLATIIISTVTSSTIVGILHLAAICSALCTVAKTNSTCFVAAGAFGSGRTATTGPIVLTALCISCRLSGKSAWRNADQSSPAHEPRPGRPLAP